MFFASVYIRLKNIWEYLIYPSKYYSKKYAKEYAQYYATIVEHSLSDSYDN